MLIENCIKGFIEKPCFLAEYWAKKCTLAWVTDIITIYFPMIEVTESTSFF